MRRLCRGADADGGFSRAALSMRRLPRCELPSGFVSYRARCDARFSVADARLMLCLYESGDVEDALLRDFTSLVSSPQDCTFSLMPMPRMLSKITR